MELMIVIAIVGILMGISLLPYGTYMEQARLSNNADVVAQEWILAHKEVRNGIEFVDSDATTPDSHAAIIFEFDEEKNSIKKYLQKFKNDDGTEKARNSDFFTTATFKKEIPFERNVKFLGTDLVATNNKEKFYYVIMPPYGKGSFYKSDYNLDSEITKIIKIGYKDATDTSPRKKDILLREYLK